MGRTLPVFVYLDKNEKVQIGEVLIRPGVSENKLLLDINVPLYVEDGDNFTEVHPAELLELEV